MNKSEEELRRISERYARRTAQTAQRYSRFNADVLAGVQEKQRALTSLLSRHGRASLGGCTILEIGCGSGTNLLELILLGAMPENLVGNELLPDRLAVASHMLPGAVRLHPGDAAELPFADASFDIVYQSTVFSSILDDALQARIAHSMWRWLRPGGGVLWYDFTYNNPANPDVRGVPLARVRSLFPDARIDARRITLAPPLARRVVRLHERLYGLFNLVPLLRTHLLCWIEKP